MAQEHVSVQCGACFQNSRALVTTKIAMLCLLMISHLNWGGKLFSTIATLEWTIRFQLGFDTTVICQPMYLFPVSIQLSNLCSFGITLVTFVSKTFVYNLFVKIQILWTFGDELNNYIALLRVLFLCDFSDCLLALF